MYHSNWRKNINRNVKRGIATILIYSSLCGCASLGAPADDKLRESMEESMSDGQVIRLAVIVLDYRPQAIHDDYIDGSSKSFDLTTLIIKSPEMVAGRELSVVHSIPPADGSVWTAAGSELIVEIKRSLLNGREFDFPPESIRIIEGRHDLE